MKRLFTTLAILFVCSSLAAQVPDTLTNGDTIPERNTPHAWTGGVHPPRVGLVLGGGGAKGAAHIGVIKYMEEIGIPISYVTGTSMGSIIGGLYALGYPPDELAYLIAHMDWSFYMSNKIERDNLSIEQRERKSSELLSIPFSIGDVREKRNDLIGSLPSGAVNSSNLLNLFNRLCLGYQDSMSFSDLPIPFACIATDLLSGDSVILNHGEFGKAIRSSMSIPGVFAPVQWGDRLLADGGMVNNFPTDVCRDMGAEIIIGVEVGSQPITDSDSLRSLPQQVMQYLSIATQGHNIENRKLCRIYITPDVTGYNMLSFSTENIDTLVERGYRQAKLHEAEFLALKRQLEKYGSCEKVLQGPRAEKLMPGDWIQIGEVNYHGISQEEIRQLISRHYITAGTHIDINALERAVSRLRGSGKYLYAHYKLHRVGDSLSNRYDIDIDLIPAKPHTLGLGFRYDSEESAAVLFHFGWNEQRAAGFKVFLDLDLAYNFGLNTRIAWSKNGAGDFNFDYNYRKSAYRVINQSVMKSHWNNQFRLYYSNRSFNHLTIMAGFLQDFFIDADSRIGSSILDPEVVGDIDIFDSEKAFAFFTEVSYDNMDDKYFAHKGTDFNVNGTIYKRNKGFFDMSKEPFAAARLTWKMYIPLGKRFTLIPQIAGRILYNYSDQIDYIDNTNHIWYHNTIGGTFNGRYFDHHIAFIGFNNVYQTELEDGSLGVLRADLRFQLSEKNYISLMANTFTSYYRVIDYDYNEELDVFTEIPSWKNETHFGMGLRLAHNSILGPIWVDIAWSTLTHRLCGFLNVGYYF